MKDPHQRLSWPELLSHPFVAGRVTGEYQHFSSAGQVHFLLLLPGGWEFHPTLLLLLLGLCLPPLGFLQALTPSSCPWTCSGSPGIPWDLRANHSPCVPGESC